MSGKFMNKYLTVDPGFNTGWAYWESHSAEPIATGCITAKDGTPMDKVGQISQLFSQLIRHIEPVRILIEDQWFSEQSLMSMTSYKTGAMKKMTWVVGGLLATAYRLHVPVEMVTPMQWKGNMGDEAVKMRIERVIGIFYKNPHIADAVGIGLNARDTFKKIGVFNEQD